MNVTLRFSQKLGFYHDSKWGIGVDIRWHRMRKLLESPLHSASTTGLREWGHENATLIVLDNLRGRALELLRVNPLLFKIRPEWVTDEFDQVFATSRTSTIDPILVTVDGFDFIMAFFSTYNRWRRRRLGGNAVTIVPWSL